MIGKIVGGHYKIIYFLGGGGFGRAYLAQDKNSSNDFWCVVKQLQPLINPLNPMKWETAKRLFDTEAEALRVLGEHERIPKLFDYFEEDQEFYLVEEFIDGYELSEELEYGIFNEKQVYELLKDVLSTLNFIQSSNIIHRDITPDNLIRRRQDNKLVLIDFGAVKKVLIDTEGKKRRASTIAIGKEVYMPDEQAGGRPGLYSDVYAVGVIGIQACIGCLPSRDDDSEEFTWRHQAYMSSELADILDKMTHCYFKKRYQSALEVLQDLNSLSLVFTNPSTTKPLLFKYNYAGMWYIRGNELKNKKHHEEAVLLYKKVIEINSRHYKAWFNMGIAFSYLKLYTEAVNCYNQALEIKSQSSEAWLHKGISLYKLNFYEEALQAFKNAIQIQPHYPVAWLYQGFTLAQLYNEKEADESYCEAVRLRPSYQRFLGT